MFSGTKPTSNFNLIKCVDSYKAKANYIAEQSEVKQLHKRDYSLGQIRSSQNQSEYQAKSKLISHYRIKELRQKLQKISETPYKIENTEKVLESNENILEIYTQYSLC